MEVETGLQLLSGHYRPTSGLKGPRPTNGKGRTEKEEWVSSWGKRQPFLQPLPSFKNSIRMRCFETWGGAVLLEVETGLHFVVWAFWAYFGLERAAAYKWQRGEEKIRSGRALGESGSRFYRPSPSFKNSIKTRCFETWGGAAFLEVKTGLQLLSGHSGPTSGLKGPNSV